MLSMNNSTSAPVESRKYSAMVRAERATRNRAPGGSFIWPKTMQVCDITLRPVSPILACCISSHRSFPSRVRSPTPAKTEKPPCAEAMRAISSVRITVLPNPAPPNKPGLAAADEGRQKIDHLDAGLEDFGLRSTGRSPGGESRWMGQ